jgi:putative DNA primase/helicase
MYDLPTNERDQKTLASVLLRATPEGRVLLVERPGWHKNQFVLGVKAIGDTEEPIMVGERLGTHKARIARRGSLKDWKLSVAAPCTKSSYLVFALSLGFAAPLLRLTNTENGGVHFCGASSQGKTTMLRGVASIFGSGDGTEAGYMRSWQLTAAANEEIAFGHCDMPLVLDELKLLDPDPRNAARRASEVAYSIAGGSAKTRSLRYEGVIPDDLKQYRLMLLSAGELSLQEHASAGGARRLRGEQTRLIDIPVPEKATGIFDRLHDEDASGVESRQLADDLQGACSQSYGKAGRIFIRKIVDNIRSDKPKLTRRIEEGQARFFKAARVNMGDGYEVRFARRFALAYAAALLGIDYCILPWSPKIVEQCIRRVYRRALYHRLGPVESITAAASRVLGQLRDMRNVPDLTKGDRQIDARTAETAPALLLLHTDGLPVLAVQPKCLQQLVGPKLSVQAVAAHLEQRKFLLPRGNGRRTRQVRIPGVKARRGYYCVRLSGFTRKANRAQRTTE